jgi:hypothetical protein
MAITADQLPDDPDALKAMVLAREVENVRLRQIIKELQRHRFGRRAETLPQDQLLLGLEEAEQIEAAGEEAKEHASAAERQAYAARRRVNRGSLPAHLPRVEMVVDIEDHACPCCRNDLHKIGEDVSERLAAYVARGEARPAYPCVRGHGHSRSILDQQIRAELTGRCYPIAFRSVDEPREPPFALLL